MSALLDDRVGVITIWRSICWKTEIEFREEEPGNSKPASSGWVWANVESLPLDTDCACECSRKYEHNVIKRKRHSDLFDWTKSYCESRNWYVSALIQELRVAPIYDYLPSVSQLEKYIKYIIYLKILRQDGALNSDSIRVFAYHSTSFRASASERHLIIHFLVENFTWSNTVNLWYVSESIQAPR